MIRRNKAQAGLLAFAGLAVVAAVAFAQGKQVLDDQMLTVGQAAPSWTLPDQNGKTHTLAQDKGKVVLLAFYPADFTGGCTLEAHSLSSADKDLAALGVRVYGVSVQDPKSHKAFCTKEGIPYTLLADTQKTAAKSYGVLIPAVGVANRVTYIIGKDGKVVYVDKDVNSHLMTCGSDWVAWLKAHPQGSGKAPGVASFTTQDGGNLRLVDNQTPLASTPAKPAEAMLGQPAPTFTLPDSVSGSATSLATLSSGKKATVVIFTSTRCPISNAYNERMIALANKYEAQGVAFVAINANHNESLDEVKTHTQQHKYPFAVLKDTDDSVADAYTAQVTPETYVINSAGVLVYHGRIDNSDDPSQVHTHDLDAAITEVLAGQPVAKPRTKAFGCSIKRAD